MFRQLKIIYQYWSNQMQYKPYSVQCNDEVILNCTKCVFKQFCLITFSFAVTIDILNEILSINN